MFSKVAPLGLVHTTQWPVSLVYSELRYGNIMEAGVSAANPQTVPGATRPNHMQSPSLMSQNPAPMPALALARESAVSAATPPMLGSPSPAPSADRRSIIRAHSPGHISLGPPQMVPPLPVQDAVSPLLPANDLPDDPQRATAAAHLYPLAPAWSPVATSPAARSDVGLTSESGFFSSPTLVRSHSTRGYFPPQCARSRTQSSGYDNMLMPANNESDIFERSTERNSTHVYSPKEAIDIAAVPALDHAADAIVGDRNSELEIVTPQSPENRTVHLSPWRSSAVLPKSESALHLPRSPGPRSPVHRSPQLSSPIPRSPGPRSPAPRSPGRLVLPNGPELSQGYLHAPNFRGHQRFVSDISGMAGPHSPRARHTRGLSSSSALSGMSDVAPGSSDMARTHSTSSNVTNASPVQSALSIDGAIIYDGEAARVDHSLGGLADAIERLSTTDKQIVRSPSHISRSTSSYFALSPHLDEQPMHPHSPGSPSLIRYRVLPGEHRTPSGEFGTPRSTRSPRGGVFLRAPPGQSPSGEERGLGLMHVPPQSQGEKKRISMMAYGDILSGADEQLLVFGGNEAAASK